MGGHVLICYIQGRHMLEELVAWKPRNDGPEKKETKWERKNESEETGNGGRAEFLKPPKRMQAASP